MKLELHPFELTSAEAERYQAVYPEIQKLSKLFWIGSIDTSRIEAKEFLTAAEHGRMLELLKYNDVVDDVFYSILGIGESSQVIITFCAGGTLSMPTFISKSSPSEEVEITPKKSNMQSHGLVVEVRWRDILKRMFT